MATESSWEGLCPELLEMIARKLSYLDATRFSAVCTSWHGVLTKSRVLNRPLRLTTVRRGVADVHGSYKLSLRLYSLAEGKFNCDSIVSFKEHYHKFYFIGSSKNTLVLQDKRKKTKIVLLSLYSMRTSRLPSLDTLDSIKREFGKRANTGRYSNLVRISRAVVLITPEKKNPVLVIIYTCITSFRSIAFFRNGSWSKLDGSEHYEDILAREKRLFAMSYSGLVEAWDFDERGFDPKPVKAISFVPSEALPPLMKTEQDQQYLFESMGEFLLVRKFFDRLIGCRVAGFDVYKSCLGIGEKWEKVESIGENKTLFLGKNESTLVSSCDLQTGCEGNSIYFNDENDTGVYSLALKKISRGIINGRIFFGESIWMIKA